MKLRGWQLLHQLTDYGKEWDSIIVCWKRFWTFFLHSQYPSGFQIHLETSIVRANLLKRRASSGAHVLFSTIAWILSKLEDSSIEHLNNHFNLLDSEFYFCIRSCRVSVIYDPGRWQIYSRDKALPTRALVYLLMPHRGNLPSVPAQTYHFLSNILTLALPARRYLLGIVPNRT